MTLIVVGLNHRSAPPNVLEKLTFSSEAVPKVLAEVSNSAVVAETVVVSTCNRTEVYVQAERFHDAFRDISDSLATLASIPSEDFGDHLYVHYDDEAVEHLFHVAAGMDSAVLGEHEILGQVRRAWDQARSETSSGALLNLLFQRAIEAGKRVRNETTIGEATASLSHAAVSLVQDKVDDLSQKNVLLVGTGDLGSGVAAAIARTGVNELQVANRTQAKAVDAAAELSATIVDFDRLASALDQADVVISATGADRHVISVDDVSPRPKDRPLLVVDIAVPRDVEPAVDDLANVETLVLTDLQTFANRGIAQRRLQLGDARKIINEELERHRTAKSARTVAPLIGSLHSEVEAMRQSEIERHLCTNEDLTPEQREAVELLTKSVLAKVLHQPTTELKEAAGTLKGERLAESVRVLFDLP